MKTALISISLSIIFQLSVSLASFLHHVTLWHSLYNDTCVLWCCHTEVTYRPINPAPFYVLVFGMSGSLEAWVSAWQSRLHCIASFPPQPSIETSALCICTTFCSGCVSLLSSASSNIFAKFILQIKNVSLVFSDGFHCPKVATSCKLWGSVSLSLTQSTSS